MEIEQRNEILKWVNKILDKSPNRLGVKEGAESFNLFIDAHFLLNFSNIVLNKELVVPKLAKAPKMMFLSLNNVLMVFDVLKPHFGEYRHLPHLHEFSLGDEKSIINLLLSLKELEYKHPKRIEKDFNITISFKNFI